MPANQTAFQMLLHNQIWTRIVLVSDGVFRIRFNLNGHFDESPLVRSGILHAGGSSCKHVLKQKEHLINIQTKQANLQLNLQDGRVVVTAEGSRGRMSKYVKPIIHEQEASLFISLEDGELLYGLGDGMRGKLQKRGLKEKMEIRNGPPYFPIPYVMSNLGWGLLLVTTNRHCFDLGSTDPKHIHISIPDHDDLDFFLFTGRSYNELLDRYTDISGKPALLPLWGYGLSTSVRSKQLNARELIQEALKFRHDAIPCDAIVLNRGWTSRPDDGMGKLIWDAERFPMREYDEDNLPTFIQILQNHGFRLGVSMKSRLDALQHAHDGNNKHAGSETSWHAHIRPLAAEGIASLNIHMNRDWLMNLEKKHADQAGSEKTPLIYSVWYVKQIYEKYVQQTNLRPHIRLDEAGYAGIQQYACTHAGGMSANTFENLEIGLSAVLSYGMSGHSNLALGLDLSRKEGIHVAFLQPWVHVPDWTMFWSPHYLQPTLKAIFRSYAKLHYRLLPYIYSAAHEAARTGFPIVRAMPLMFPDDPNCNDLTSQYMLGNDLLAGAFTQTVYLPDGKWIDFWSGKQVSGGQTIQCDIPDHAGGPLFIRAGAIIPMWPDMDFVGQTAAETIDLHIYPYENSSFTLYEDDGISMEYLEGKTAITRIESECSDQRGTIRIFRRQGTYEGMPARRIYELFLHLNRKPSTIRINGKLYKEKQRSRSMKRDAWQYNRRTGVVRITAEETPIWETTEKLEVEFVFPLAASNHARHEALSPSLPSPLSANSSGANNFNARFPPEAELCRALHEGDLAALENSLLLWRQERRRLRSSPEQWQLDVLKAALLAIRQVERRGWEYDSYFKSDIEMFFQLEQLKSADEAYSRLLHLLMLSAQCQPKLASEVKHPAISELIFAVEQHMAKKIVLHELADRVGVHRDHLSRLFRSETGESFSAYLMKQRMEKAKALLEFGVQISHAAALTGYADNQRFSADFSKYWKIDPKNMI